jgi:hypothetical protein
MPFCISKYLFFDHPQEGIESNLLRQYLNYFKLLLYQCLEFLSYMIETPYIIQIIIYYILNSRHLSLFYLLFDSNRFYKSIQTSLNN